MYLLRNFKGFAEAQASLERPVTVLIGPNGSGKSNLIEALELIRYAASGRPLHAVSDIGRGGQLEVRGGLQGCARRGSTTCLLSARGSVEFEGVDTEFEYGIELRGQPAQEVVAEALKVGDRMLFEASTATSGVLSVQWDNFRQGPNKPTASVAATQSALSQYEQFTASNRRLEVCSSTVTHLRERLSACFVFDPQPRLMRSYERIGNNVLQRDCSNLSAVLYSLKTGTSEQQSSLATISSRIAALPEEPMSGIDFVEVPGGLKDVIFGLVKPGAGLVDARVLSDGTLRALAVLTALETCRRDSVLVIEEFDNGIHPGRLHAMYEAVRETAARRSLRVLVTTHNPATLDTLSDSELEGVLVAHWSVEEDTSKLTPLLDVVRVGELLERGRLGAVVTRRLLENYLAPAAESARKAQLDAWFGSLP